MKRGHLLIWILMVIATVFGVFGQWLSYWVDVNHAVYYLTGFTILSVFIYFITPLLAFWMIRTKKINREFTLAYTLGFVAIGFCVSVWSVFVCAMWWG